MTAELVWWHSWLLAMSEIEIDYNEQTAKLAFQHPKMGHHVSLVSTDWAGDLVIRHSDAVLNKNNSVAAELVWRWLLWLCILKLKFAFKKQTAKGALYRLKMEHHVSLVST